MALDPDRGEPQYSARENWWLDECPGNNSRLDFGSQVLDAFTTLFRDAARDLEDIWMEPLLFKQVVLHQMRQCIAEDRFTAVEAERWRAILAPWREMLDSLFKLIDEHS
jgi:hypothetical protein